MMAIYVYTTPHSIGYLIYTAYQHLADIPALAYTAYPHTFWYTTLVWYDR